MNILEEFSERIITGVGGLHDYERCEMATPKYDRDVATVIWAIKCLANPKCKGSEEVLQAIIDRRKSLAAEQSVQRIGVTLCPECGVEQIVEHRKNCSHYEPANR